MTTINIIVQSGGVHLLTDGAKDGPRSPLGYMSHPKVQIFPHMNCAVAVSGSALFAGILNAMLPDAGRTFDDLRRGGLLQGAQAILYDMSWVFEHSPKPVEFTAYVAGLDERGTPAAFVLSNSAQSGFAAWVPQDIGAFIFQPMSEAVLEGVSDAFGGQSPDDLDPERDGLRIMEIQRSDPAVAHLCRDFAQLTTITRDGITSRILRRWDEDRLRAAA